MRHAKFDVHEDDVVILAAVALSRCNDSDPLLLHRPDERAAVHRVARKTVELPAEDPGGLAGRDASHHVVEHGASRSLGRARFGEDLANRKAEPLSEPLYVINLRVNREDLAIFGFSGLAAVKKEDIPWSWCDF